MEGNGVALLVLQLEKMKADLNELPPCLLEKLICLPSDLGFMSLKYVGLIILMGLE